KRTTPDAFFDQGESFFPDFTDPNTAATLEVIEFDEGTAEARPFKVTNQNGLWTIPSHHNYPADGEDRLAKTAAGVISIRKDDFRSDNISDHEACGVIDPLDESVSTLKGRGKRVIIKGENDQVLADLIIGKELEDRENFHFVRVPDQKRVYAARIDVDISTKFEDWIKKGLLQVNRGDIDRVILKDYSINERTLRVVQRDTVQLDKKDGQWEADRMSPNQEVDSAKMNALLSGVDDLSIVGVRPKPPGISESLRRVEVGLPISSSDLLSLQSKGYYFTRDGNLLSNEGELQVRTTDGILYTLRFGEVLYGRGEAVSAGAESSDDRETGPGENRYLFITAELLPRLFPEPEKPANTDYENKAESDWTEADRRNKELKEEYAEWEEKIRKGEKLASELSARFAKWYYVISAESFDKIHLERKDLIKKKSS
ncbi:MAG: DUF4340 domain-containing protein, partial [Acidobacteriota bacterium]